MRALLAKAWPKRLILLKILLVCAFIVLTNFGFADRVAHLILKQRWVTLVAFLFVWGLAVVAVMIAAFQPRWPARLFWALLITVSTTCAVGYYSISGSEFTIFDVVSLWNARQEAGRAAGFYGPQLIALTSIVFLSGLVVIGFPARLTSARAQLWLKRLVLVPILPFAAIAFIVGTKVGNGYQAMPKQFAPVAITAVAMGKIATQDHHVRGEVAWTPVPEKRVKNILFLVDESIRADYLDFTPGNVFTPQLARLKADLVDFGPAASGGNCSHYSNFILRSAARRSDLIASVNTSPFIWNYAKKAGYRTVFIDAQGSILKDPGRLQNFMTVAETQFIDRYVSLSYVSPDQADFELLRIIAEELKGDQPVFIYANKNGSHFPYDVAYPKDHAEFGPTATEAGTDDGVPKIASYRNAVAWSVDEFFDRFFKEVDLTNLAMVYTSDHGQALQKGALTHCTVENPDPRQGLVPLMAYAGDPSLKQRLAAGAAAGHGKASHFTIVPALLEMMGYPPADIAGYYGESLFTQPAAAPAFSSGDIFGLFSNEVLWHPIDLGQDYREPESLALVPRLPRTASAKP
jgi:lipid A ethanolaminephosphotransferase